jgi:hypothetical protein
MARRIRTGIVVLAAILLLVLAAPGLVTLAADWYWFQAVGFQIVFIRTLAAKALLGLGVAAAACVFFYFNLRFAQRGIVPKPIVFSLDRAQSHQLDLNRVFRRVTWPAALFLAFLVGSAATNAGLAVLTFLYHGPFQVTDPLFHRDLAYYVFTLPVLNLALGLTNGLTVLSLLLVGGLYLLRGDLIVRRRPSIEPSAQMHLAVLIALLFATGALRTLLVGIPAMMYAPGGSHIFGATYADLHARLPLMRVGAVIAGLSAVAVLVGAVRRQLVSYLVGSLALYAGVAGILGGLIPAAVQRFSVLPNELVRETPQLRYHIAATRQAWALDSVEVRDLSGEASLSLKDIQSHSGTIRNVRLWDRDPLLQTFGQIQSIRTYYDFVSVDDDRYWIDGKYRQVLLSPRELNPAALPTRTFINEHLTFTHGMGLTLGPVNQVTAEGLPVLFVKDLPPASSGSLTVSRPQIYYGELAQDYVFVNTRQREFDHPSGEENVYAAYAGTGGVRVGNLIRRLILAFQFGSSKILFSQDITDDSRVLYYRNIVVRAEKALPFLRFDRDPYLVIGADGALRWILDAYTTSDRYPYAQRLDDGTTYMRNSVKVVIDAYHGSLVAYVSAPNDPLIRTWARVFPGIFTPLDRMPVDLRAHIRYPDDLYRVQTRLYTTYHMDAPEDFYHREDQWQIPVVAESGGAVPFMRHIVMRLPDEAKAEYIYMVPFTPRGKDNLAAWMVARNDGDVYGKLRVYRLSRQSLVFGPQQIENRINQNTEVSRQVSLWDQRGSKVIWGDLLVIPINQSLLYVQPLYLQAEGGKIPELKRVVVAYQNQVVMHETLDGGLAELFGGSAGTRSASAPSGGAGPGPEAGARAPTGDAAFRALALEARRRYLAALQAQRDNDWARYGEEMRRLGELLEQIGGEGAGPRQ